MNKHPIATRSCVVPRHPGLVPLLLTACLTFSVDTLAQGQLQAAGDWLWEYTFGALWGRLNGQRSIHLYGSVVDQHGLPVEDVEVAYHAIGSFLSSGTGHQWTHTDSKGNFHTSGARGLSLLVDGLYKPGYAFNFADDRGRTFSRPPFDPRFPEAEDWNAYSARKPYQYRIWKIEDRTEKRRKLFEDVVSLSLIPDGRWYSLNLKTERENRLSKGENPFADVFIAVQRGTNSLTVTLRGNGGGFLPETDGQGYQAPEHGYQEIWTHTTPSLREDGAKHRLYFKSLIDGRKTYGHFSMDLIPVLPPRKDEDTQRSGVSVSYTTNGQGGRELVTQPWRP